MNKNSSLSKTCSNCGLEKPLSAFLQIAGPDGTMYGNLCASCRSGKIDKAAVVEEDLSTSSSGLKIDAKTKKKHDDEKLRVQKEISEKYKAEREKLKEKNLLNEEKIDKHDQLEKKHRESFLNRRTISTTDRTEVKKAAPAAPVAGIDQVDADAAVRQEEKQQTDQAIREEAQTKGFDPHAEQRPSQTGSLLKTQGHAFRSWIQLIGPSAAISRAFGVDKQAQNKGGPDNKPIDKDAAKDYLEERSNPTKSRGR